MNFYVYYHYYFYQYKHSFKKIKITIPNLFEIIILLFIFSAEILGEINNFYMIIPHWDIILQKINGFLIAAVGFALIELLNENSTNFKLSPTYLTKVAFCFSMTIGVVRKFFEYNMDSIYKLDMQKRLHNITNIYYRIK